MTVGLFIALLLEGGVERHHKAELKHEAETNLHQEILDNQKVVTGWVTVMLTEEDRLKRAISFIEAAKAGKLIPLKGDEFGFTEKLLNDASWRTASGTGRAQPARLQPGANLRRPLPGAGRSHAPQP